tara:strand:- start:4 stop:228 length:225 start_codon:yes stop_codon:yes gene_type:complete
MKDNKLIAEFMGVDANTKRLIALDNYDTSWDWLMPVVKKCDDLTVDDMVKSGDISDTHSAVVEFIKWYNENRKS